MSILRILLTLFLCILGTVIPGLAQPPLAHLISAEDYVYPAPKFESYDLEIDSNNYLYFGSNAGAFKFNGYDIVEVEPLQDLPKKPITSMFKDAQGNIWVGLYRAGLGIITPEGIAPYHYPKELKQFIQISVEHFYKDREDRIHLALRGVGYFTISADSTVTEKIGQSSGLHGFVACQLADGSYFHFSIGQQAKTEKGEGMQIFWWDGKDSIRSIAQLDMKALKYESTLIKNQDGAFTLSTGGNEIVTWKGDSLLQHIRFPNPVIKLFEDNDQNLWIGTVNDGIHRVSNRDFSKTEHYLKGEAAAVVTQDLSGGLWIKSESSAFYYLPQLKRKWYSNKNGDFNFDRMSITSSSSTKVVCANTGPDLVIFEKDTIYKIPRPKKDPIPGRKPVTAFPTAVHLDPVYDRIWLGYWGSVFSWNGTDWTRFEMPTVQFQSNRISRLTTLPDGTLWGCTPTGVFRIQPGSEIEVFLRPKKLGYVYCLSPDSNGTIWIGTTTGLWQMKGESYEAFQAPDEFSKKLKSPIYNLHTAFGRILVQTYHNGLFAIQGKEVQEIVNEKGNSFGLAEFITGPNGGIWGRSQNQVPKLTHLTLKEGMIQSRAMPFDLLGNAVGGFDPFTLGVTQYGIYSGEKDKVFFSSFEDLDIPLPKPQVILQKIFINHQEAPIQSSYTLEHYQNSLNFSFDPISYRSASQHFRIRLLGWKDHWQESDHQEIQFTNLDPGRYQFQLQTKKTDEDWVEGPLIDFYIQTPLWETWWFLTLMFLVLIIGIGLIFFAWTRIKIRRASLVIEKLTAEQRALRAQMNPHFLFNALSSIQELVYSKDRLTAFSNIAMFAKLMRKILVQSSLELVTLSEEIETLELYLQLESLRFVDNFQYSLMVDPLIDVEKQFIPPVLIQPFVENAIKHGLLKKEPVIGTVKVRFDLQDDGLLCVVEDNGIGRKRSAEIKAKRKTTHQSFGTQSVLDRIHLLNLQREEKIRLSIHDLEDIQQQCRGTRVELFIPN